MLFTGCDTSMVSGSSGPPVGKKCTIQFRRDALGTAASLPVPPMTGNVNGADTSISGTVKSVTEEWVVLDGANGEIWIPRTVILLIQY
jgi:hypothetical protein